MTSSKNSGSLLNRKKFNCDDRIIITISDIDLMGGPPQEVSVWSDTEPLPETVICTENGANPETFA